MTDVVVHVMLGVKDGVMEEASRECELSEVQALVDELDVTEPTWRAITILHLEDHPLLLQGSEHMGPVAS